MKYLSFGNADNVNLVGKNINTVPLRKINIFQHNTKVATKSFKAVDGFSHLGMTVINHRVIQKVIKSRLYPGNAC
jgi:hypothetical protein